ncbi:taurine catabolism dioxygenase [Pterulicium gracile]|uniref:Taurine catabolism dioxygenase n=1 Tax=Pterulicium gracile TaxID=1884261 RepID=A0A5C3QEK8_9AGAR|nr:taurine catabolism dioxygenase [Pterula gracilis]
MASSESQSLLGSLAGYSSLDETAHVGTLFHDLQVSTLLSAPDADQQIKDLATLISHRGVVFFKNQDISVPQMKELTTKLGELSGKPESSKLHVHPISEDTPELPADISVISSMGGISRADVRRGTRASNGWHADITFENVPSDYTMLKMHTVPRIGGDTLWASGYEAYDRLSPAMKRFLEGLTAVHDGSFFLDYAKSSGIKVQESRGSPENTGTHLKAVHPVIRTNPVTGFRTLYVNKTFTKRIVELREDESDNLLDFLFRHLSENHDLQVRYRWSSNDLAIWDNRSSFHTATNDYDAPRGGNRVVSVGERPFFDPKSRSRREALGLPELA